MRSGEAGDEVLVAEHHVRGELFDDLIHGANPNGAFNLVWIAADGGAVLQKDLLLMRNLFGGAADSSD